MFFFVSAQEMIDSPFDTKSDSFYFVDNKLIMHNKADYAYNGGLGSMWFMLHTPLKSRRYAVLVSPQTSSCIGQKTYCVEDLTQYDSLLHTPLSRFALSQIKNTKFMCWTKTDCMEDLTDSIIW